jgi:hypothetical protein
VTKTIFNWGPGVHLHLGNMVLADERDNKRINEIEIIKRNRTKFLYGTIAPDITLGKKYIKDLEKHSHIWETGFNILKNAEKESEIAFALGYLSHLASDIIAHNFFLPKQLVVSRGLRGFAHTILELKIDMGIYRDTYDVIKKMAEDDFTDEDEFLKKQISEAILPFGVNRKIFDYSLRSVKSKYFYNILNLFTSHKKWKMENREMIREYHDLSFYMIMDVLIYKEKSIVTKYDPNGDHNFQILKELRKEYKILSKEFEDVHKRNYYIIPGELRGIRAEDKNGKTRI